MQVPCSGLGAQGAHFAREFLRHNLQLAAESADSKGNRLETFSCAAKPEAVNACRAKPHPLMGSSCRTLAVEGMHMRLTLGLLSRHLPLPDSVVSKTSHTHPSHLPR